MGEAGWSEGPRFYWQRLVEQDGKAHGTSQKASPSTFLLLWSQPSQHLTFSPTPNPNSPTNHWGNPWPSKSISNQSGMLARFQATMLDMEPCTQQHLALLATNP